MEQATRIKIAGLATALFIGALTAGGVAVRTHHATHATAAAPTPAVQPSFSTATDDDGAQAPDGTGLSEIDDE